MRMPPAQKSLIIYNDGSVVEGHFEKDDVKEPSVYMFILGGHGSAVRMIRLSTMLWWPLGMTLCCS